MSLMRMKNHRSFQHLIFRTFILFALGVIVVFIISLANFYLFLSRYYVTYCDNVLSQTKSQIDNVLGKMTLSQRQVFGIVCDSPVYKSEEFDEKVMLSGRDLLTSIYNVTYTNDDIDNIYIYMYRNDGFYTTANYYYDKSAICENIDRNRERGSDGLCYDLTMNKDGNEIETINFYTYAYEMGTKEISFGLCVSLKYSVFGRILDSINLHESQQVYITADDGTVIYSRGNGDMPRLCEEGYAATDVSILKNQIVISQEVDAIDWRLTVVVDYFSLFITLFKDLFIVIGISGIMVTVLWVFLAYFRSKALASPINEIIGQINGYPEHKELLDIRTDNGDVALLVENYNRLIRRIERLHEQNIKQEKEKLKVEYEALLSQINPHFLFNVLDGLRGMAVKYRARDISLTVRSLSLMLQYSLVESHEAVTLKDELENLENYLMIIEKESGNVVHKFYEIAPEAYEAEVIRFMLQPIVENSMKFRFKGEQSAIWINAFRRNDSLVIVIRDNGIGIEKEKAERINAILERGGNLKEYVCVSGTGIGLSNISKRLQYSFGPGSVVKIEPGKERGAVVTVTVHYEAAADRQNEQRESGETEETDQERGKQYGGKGNDY